MASESIREQLLALLGRKTGAPAPSPPSPDITPPKLKASPVKDWRHTVSPRRSEPRGGFGKSEADYQRLTSNARRSAETSRPIDRKKPPQLKEGALRGPISIPIKGGYSYERTARTAVRSVNQVISKLKVPSGFTSSGPSRFESPFRAKSPEPWVVLGAALQVTPGAQQTMTVRLGVDFGTAFSKVAARIDKTPFFVDWGGIQTGPSGFLLSGELSEMSSGVLKLGRHEEAAHVIQDLKIPFLALERSPEPPELANAVIFLSHVLRYARAWIYHHYLSLVAGNRLIWELNLGAPTGTWSTSQKLLDRYRRVGLAAWQLSQEPAPNTERARQLLSGAQPGNSGWGLDALAVLPEFVAQIAGYVNSPQRKSGMYLLADVGAGTLDVACFRVILDEEGNSLPVLGCRVDPLGTHFLMQLRQRKAQSLNKSWLDACAVPSAEQLAVMWDCNKTDVEAADGELGSLVSSVVHGVLSYSKSKKDRRAEEWSGSMPVLMVGGGGGLAPYRDAVAAGFRRAGMKPSIRSLPIPTESRAQCPLRDLDFGRLSVAYGLTFDAELIGKMTPPDGIPDDTLLSGREFVTHEEIYG